jgi:hypothetical protein
MPEIYLTLLATFMQWWFLSLRCNHGQSYMWISVINIGNIPSCSGRGSRAILKRLKNGTVVHDASYFTPIQLDGPEVKVTVFLLLACNFVAWLSSLPVVIYKYLRNQSGCWLTFVGLPVIHSGNGSVSVSCRWII